MEFVDFHRIGHTYSIRFYDKKKHQVNGYFIQLSLKDMWLYPHKEQRFNNGSWLCGWLFFYFGIIVANGK